MCFLTPSKDQEFHNIRLSDVGRKYECMVIIDNALKYRRYMSLYVCRFVLQNTLLKQGKTNTLMNQEMRLSAGK